MWRLPQTTEHAFTAVIDRTSGHWARVLVAAAGRAGGEEREHDGEELHGFDHAALL
jgi:hypothetical protein